MDLGQSCYVGKPTYQIGITCENGYPRVHSKDHKTNKCMTQWVYNDYPENDEHLTEEDNTGINRFKIGHKSMSLNNDVVDSTYYDKKFDHEKVTHHKKAGLRRDSVLKRDMHGKVNDYVSFKDIFQHRFVADDHDVLDKFNSTVPHNFMRDAQRNDGQTLPTHCDEDYLPSYHSELTNRERLEKERMMQSWAGPKPPAGSEYILDYVGNKLQPAHSDLSCFPRTRAAYERN